jgi:hypothetical protein
MTATTTISSSASFSRARLFVLVSAILAVAVPVLWNDDRPPSATVLTQCVAIGLWGLLVLALRPSRWSSHAASLHGAVLLVAAGVAASWLFGTLPRSLALCALGGLGSAGILAWAGAIAAGRADGVQTHKAFMAGLLVAGGLNAAIGLLQVFAPAWADGTYIAQSHVPGRAVGNLHHPNLLGSLLVWALVATASLTEQGRLRRSVAFPVACVLVLVVELTGSRTGVAGLFLLAGWGWLDKRLSPSVRRMLMALPLIFAFWFLATEAWGLVAGSTAVGAGGRLHDESVARASPNSRAQIWANTLELISQQPWQGVGFGEFNLAWSLTPFPGRPTAFFDHTHNLPLELFVELGIPMGGIVVVLLGLALWQGWKRSFRHDGDIGIAKRATWVLLLTIMAHSMVEYPLWYLWFLLPTAFAWGFTLGGPVPAADPSQTQREPARAWLLGVLLMLGGVAAAVDYQRVADVYQPAATVNQAARQIARGQRSLFFAHYADYVAATAVPAMPAKSLGIERALHSLLDWRLMAEWAQQLAARGELDQARFIAQRLREFQRPEAEGFFEICKSDPRAFQCQPPARTYGWRELVEQR